MKNGLHRRQEITEIAPPPPPLVKDCERLKKINDRVANAYDFFRCIDLDERLYILEMMEHAFCYVCGRERPDLKDGLRGPCDHAGPHNVYPPGGPHPEIEHNLKRLPDHEQE